MSGVSLVNTIQSEIEKAQLDLKGVDENLRKLTGRDFGDSNQRPEQRRGRLLSGGRDDEPPAKRRPQGVFARLGGVVLEQHYNESRGRGRGGFRRNSDGVEPRGERSDSRGDLRAEIQGGGGEPRGSRRVQEVVEEDDKMPKPSLASSVARPQVDFKSRTEAAAELTKDRASRDRNRRMFGALLGTLKRFRNEEIKQKDKEEQRAAIDRKLEEKGRAEKEELRRERLDLFNLRKERQAQIRRLTLKMARVKEHEAWESHMMKLTKFIRTKASPRIFWLPQTHNSKTTSLVRATHDIISRELEENRQRLKEELDEILGSRADDDQGEEGRDAAEGGEEEEEESDSFMRRGIRSEIARQGEGGAMNTLDSCADLLDYEAEEGELVYDVADLSGKDNNDTERVVVQVDGRGIGGRKVEIVGGQALDRAEGLSKLGGGNDSEKENQGRLKDKDKSKDKDRNADRDRRHRDKGRDKDRGKDKDKGKEGERERGSDKHSGRDKDKKKDKPKDKSKDSEKEKSKSKMAEVEEPMSPDLEATIVHIKIEKDDEDFVKENETILKTVKEEKLEKSSGNAEKDEDDDRNTSINDTLPDGELPPSPTIAVPLPTDFPSPPRDSLLDASSSPTATGASVSSVIPASSPKHSPPLHPSSSPSIPSSPLPQQPNQSTPSATSPFPLPFASISGKDFSATDAREDEKEGQMEVEEQGNDNFNLSTSLNIKPGDIQLPEGNPVQQVSSADNRKSSKPKVTKEDKKVSDKSEKSKKKMNDQKSDHKKSDEQKKTDHKKSDEQKKTDHKKSEEQKKTDHKKSEEQKKTDHKKSDDQKKTDHKKSDELKKTDEKKGSKKVDSGSSDDSSSEDSSSDSSSDSSESDSSDSESSSSSSGSSSGSSSDSESDSSSSSSTDSQSGGEKKKKQKKKRGGRKKDESRSEDSSSDSEREGKSKKKKKYDQGKLKHNKKNDSKLKIKEEPPSDNDKSKKNSSSKDKKKDGEKTKEKEPGYKSKDKERDRDSARKQEREKGKLAGRSKSRERKKDRSRSRDRRRERSRSRDKNRRDRKDRR